MSRPDESHTRFIDTPEYRALEALYLLGRLANGAERGKGHLIHAVPVATGTALCGATYGRRSAGWQKAEQTEFTCPRCLKAAALRARLHE